MSGNNGEKKSTPTPMFEEEWKDAFIYVALMIISNLTHKQANISIKQEALETFPKVDKPLFIWNNSKKHWMVMNPKKKEEIITPNKRIIGS